MSDKITFSPGSFFHGTKADLTSDPERSKPL